MTAPQAAQAQPTALAAGTTALRLVQEGGSLALPHTQGAHMAASHFHPLPHAAPPAVSVVIVPGWRNSPAGHWQSLWADRIPGAIRVQQADWAKPHKEAWVDALEQAIAAAPHPVVLVAHSLGCITAVHVQASLQARIAGALSEGWDEVLVVGHSSGVHLGISVMADLVRTGRVPANGPALGFLSLGHVVPMVSFLPKAGRLRADLALLSQQAGVAWVDVTAPGDGCAFALCDPVAVSGMAGPGKRWPLVLSAAFSQTLSPERLQALRRRYLRLHFQYMCAFDRPGDYDYFLITAGPEILAARFSGRAASKSRIERPLNRYGATR